jgi:hypothetical protein
MKKILAVALLWTCACSAKTMNPTGAWLPTDVKWEHAPVQVNPRLEVSSTTVLYFDQKGGFTKIDCTLNREQGYMTMSHGDGQVVYSGRWDGHIPGRIMYRVVSRTVALKGETFPGPWHEDTLASEREFLLLDGRVYKRANELLPSVRQLLLPATK